MKHRTRRRCGSSIRKHRRHKTKLGGVRAMMARVRSFKRHGGRSGRGFFGDLFQKVAPALIEQAAPALGGLAANMIRGSGVRRRRRRARGLYV